MRLNQGLFKLDFDDHYAVLGLPVNADGKVVRKRYLQIARRLHPDSMAGSSAEAIQKASETLSKLVNPAYETLSQEKSSTEYQLVLKLRGQTLQQAPNPPDVDTDTAQQLLKTSQVDADYQKAVRGLALEQYDKLDTLEATIGQLSELNLVYLYRTGTGSGESTRSHMTQAKSTSAGGAQKQKEQAHPRRVRDTILESYIKRAQDFERIKDPGRAILELREALKTYPKSAPCHSYLASLYLKAGQTTMAKIHAKKALDINPNDEQAKAIQAHINRGAGSSAKSSETAGSKKGDGGGKSGGFFGLFGGKKK